MENFRVDCRDDHEFKMARQRLIELRGVDNRSDWDRVDKVAVFNKEELLNKIQRCEKMFCLDDPAGVYGNQVHAYPTCLILNP